MRCTCLVLNNSANALFNKGAEAAMSAFYHSGYVFEEIRVLPQADCEAVVKTISELKNKSELVAVLCAEAKLSIVRERIIAAISGLEEKGAFCGATIFEDADSAICLLAMDKMATGAEYVKEVCIPFLGKKFAFRSDKIIIRSMGASEARVDALLLESKRLSAGTATYRHTRRYDEDVIEIIYDGNTPKMAIDDTMRLLLDGLGDTVYALEDVSLETQLVTLLKVRGKKISVAESFTGGGLARRIVSVSGASEVYFEGVNTYDERSKIKRLGVSDFTLGSKGAVSDQTAYEMALGLLNTGDCDIAVATTGLAGPKSDRHGNPVGLCFIAVGTKEKITVYRYKFDGEREEITEKGINYALYHAYKHLKNI